MRKINCAFMAGSVLVVAGCCCTPKDLGGDCGGDTATIVAGAAQLHVKPECLTVNAGESLTLEVKTARGVGAITVESKPGPQNASEWLRGTSREGEPIVIEAPDPDADRGACEEDTCEYQFWVEAENVGKLDPRVRVRYARH